MLVRSMTANQPIDYARAESADVVRKKFRRRVVTFLVATVVVVVIGGGWVHAARVGGFSIGNFYSYSMRAAGMGEIVELPGPEREDLGPENWLYGRTIGDSTVGVWLTQFNRVSWPKWNVTIRYRTLFILAMIPWIITLIRLIRSWRRKRMAQSAGMS